MLDIEKNSEIKDEQSRVSALRNWVGLEQRIKMSKGR